MDSNLIVPGLAYTLMTDNSLERVPRLLPVVFFILVSLFTGCSKSW